MSGLHERITALSPAKGYHITGLVFLDYIENKAERLINIKIQGQDAMLLANEEDEQSIAEMIASIYNHYDIDEDPPCMVERLNEWKLTITSVL